MSTRLTHAYCCHLPFVMTLTLTVAAQMTKELMFMNILLIFNLYTLLLEFNVVFYRMGVNGAPFTDGYDIIIVKDAAEAPLLETVFYNFFKDKKCLACS